MADEEDVLSDIDLDNFNFDDLSFEKETGLSPDGGLFSDDGAIKENTEEADPITTAFVDTNEDNVSENSENNEAFAMEIGVAEEVSAESEVAEEPQFEEAFANEEMPTEATEVAEEPQFEEAFASEEMSTEAAEVAEEPQLEEAFANEEMPMESEVAEEPQFEEKTFEEDFSQNDIENVEKYSPVDGVEASDNVGYLRWYSGTTADAMFEVSKNFMSGHFKANENQKAIHVNVGYDTYGWNVQFFDGVTMNLRDVREYQIRNGKLPYPDGRITYGKQSVEFSGIERIVIYESVKYFSYGV